MKDIQFAAWTLTCALCACAQNLKNSIDGVAIPDKVLAPYTRENAINDLWVTQGVQKPTDAQIQQRIDQYGVCSRLRSQIEYSAKERAVKEFGITVTPQEEAAERARGLRTIPPDAAERMQAVHDLLPPALAQVYDEHKDPDQVYRASGLAAQGITPDAWGILYRQPLAKTAEGRAKIAKQYQTGADLYRDPSKGHYDAKHTVERQKLAAEVDRRLAASDPQFAADLRNYQATEQVNANGSVGHRGYSLAEQQYMEQKRAEFWAARQANLRVTLSDPSLKAKCGLR
jgi:hypothetical protein